KELAKHYGIPILRNVPLAQALNKLDIDEDSPEEHYEAVAEVLAFVYKIKEEQESRQSRQSDDREQAQKARVAQMGPHASAPGQDSTDRGPGGQGPRGNVLKRKG
ncbi:MAG: EscU/YscU/HrcU family type III secretion system export apparatus switch protein, partial [Candidatus Devosia euplotis]|nr:EscU/YscU/HrcU family type III secretion system export apparatus switch protein [Candidatus Devosia euplotis]